MKKKIRWSSLYSFSCLRSPVTDQVGQKGFTRVVHCNDSDNAELAQLGYRDNYVSTTKYTPANFVFKSVYEQIKRVANIYFLVVAGVSFSPVTPYSAYSIILPLGMVIGATIIKEGVEDWRRRTQDVEANNRRVGVYRDSAFHETKWMRLRVGDIVKVNKDEYFPADLILISSGFEDGICHVDTMNLDGETNLKVKQASEVTLCLKDEESLRGFRAVINCEEPNDKLHEFSGTLYLKGQEHSLSFAQILLRDSKLKNIDHIYGAIIYTGHDTKVMQNATKPSTKRSNVEKRMDKIILILFSVLTLISVGGSITFGFETEEDKGKIRRWYLRPDNTKVLYDPGKPLLAVFLHFLTALMLYGYLIPISLYVSIEVVKVLQSIFINHDHGMYDEDSDKPARARTSNLNEELGQVNTILSDKTGTLTCNSMDFVKCSIAGTAYGRGLMEVEVAMERRTAAGDSPSATVDRSSNVSEFGKLVKGFNFFDERIMDGKWVSEPHADVIQNFFRVLAVCHTAVADGDEDSEITYEAESPDEVAFVVAARELGFQFFNRTQSVIQVYEVDYDTGERFQRVYKLEKTLEFTSARKCMSVIVRDMENKLLLLCKGADSVMFQKLAENGRQYEAKTKAHIQKYAEAGLRTLVIACREIDEEVYKRWEEEFAKAKTSVSEDREALVERTAEKIEKGLILLGATAVEDKLQKGVPECIQKLSQADIKIWVLTGDKMETATNIGYACSLLRRDMTTFTIIPETPDIVAVGDEENAVATAKASKESVTRQVRDASAQIEASTSVAFGLIVDGKALDYLLLDDAKMLFFDLAVRCSSVICCRSTPRQKSLVTKLVKDGTGKTTLAVGDGANDVGMLREADIGVGISGFEGMQAVMASDFSIGQFRFLERLLLVHGHWCYRRISMMICYFFYKNITFGITLFWFEAFADFSGQAMYNDWYMSLYNVFFTSFPVIALGVFDQDVSARDCLKYPELYREGISNELFCWWRITGWIGNGAFSSAVIFFFTTNAATFQAFRRDGHTVDYEVLGVMLYSSVVWTVNCQMALAINYFTWIQHAFIWGSIGLWYLFVVMYGSITPDISTTAYKVFVEACLLSPFYWLVTFFLVVATLLPYFAFRAFQSRFTPMYHDKIQQGLLEDWDKRRERDELLCPPLRTGLKLDNHTY